MNFTRNTIFALAAAIGAALPATAGLKYWTTGGYDADSYVQEGLVLNYDGIRNAGLGQPHSTNATTWVNLGSGGSAYDMTRYSRVSGTTWTKNGNAKGSWEDDGFAFAQDSRWETPSSNPIAISNFTAQLVGDFDHSKQTGGDNRGYILFGGGNDSAGATAWKTYGLAVRPGTDNNYQGEKLYITLDNWMGGSKRSRVITPVEYATIILAENETRIFTGTNPSDATGNSRHTGRTNNTERTIPYLCVGSNGSSNQSFTGDIKSYRHYDRILSSDELIWNRAVDQTRFFGAAPASTISVTNAVIASSIAIVQGNEKSGAYAVDTTGYTFTAPASRTVEGRAYACTGYTIETWDSTEGDWGTPVLCDGERSCAVTETSRVRITWQWTPGDGIVTRYDVGDYVQDGLLLNYDGIRNAGAGEPHSFAPARWVNLAPGGGLDMTLAVISTEGADPGEWRRDGYHFERQSYFHPGAAFTLPSNQTIQVAVDANGLGQKAYDSNGDSNEAYIYYAMGVTFNKAGSLSLRRDTSTTYYNEWFDWTVHGYGDSNTRPKPGQYRGLPVRYCTAVLADTFGAAFMGTSVPTEQTDVNGAFASRRDFTSGPPIVQNATDFGIGGIADNTGRKFTGTLQSFRFYGRVLTDAELEHNRMIDDYRFHGVMPVTNVVVASSRFGMAGNERIGPYEISGSYTFTAPASRTDARGIEFVCTGYTIEAWNASAGCWDAPVSYASGAYTWAASSSHAKVRLTWQWKASGALLTAADYDITDYVAGGLVLNFDGIKNLGADLPDVTDRFSSLSRAWANSAPFGGYDMGFNNKGPTATWLGDSTWTANGFSFTNKSFFSHSGAFTVSPKSTQQTLVDGIGNSLANGGSLDNGETPRGYVFMASGAWNKAGSFSFVSNTKNSWVDLPAHGFSETTGDTARCDPCLKLGANLTYATGIMGDGYMAAFYGAEIPVETTTRWTNPSRLPTTGFGLEPSTVTVSYLGAGGSTGGQAFTGIVKSYRHYDRVLTNDELRRNRQVDSARFFGELAFTNVVVKVEDGLNVTATPAPGAYAVEGSYTFTCTAGTDTPDGYKLETWDETTQSWTASNVESLSYTYDAATSPAMVRITWRKINPFVMVIR